VTIFRYIGVDKHFGAWLYLSHGSNGAGLERTDEKGWTTMLRTSDKDLGNGLFMAYSIRYQAAGETAEGKSTFKNIERFEAEFKRIMSFARKHLKLPNDISVRVGLLKKRGVTAEFHPALNLIALEPQPNFTEMLRSLFYELVQVDQIKTGKLRPLTDMTYAWSQGAKTEEITVPKGFFARAHLPHISDAENRTEMLIDELAERYPDIFNPNAEKKAEQPTESQPVRRRNKNEVELHPSLRPDVDKEEDDENGKPGVKARAKRGEKGVPMHPSLSPEKVEARAEAPAPAPAKRSTIKRRLIAAPGTKLPGILERRKAKRAQAEGDAGNTKVDSTPQVEGKAEGESPKAE
jgi:hypothetical protein